MTDAVPDQSSPSWRTLFARRTVARTPTILQMEAVECGAAALAIVLAHYGAWIPLEQLRVACGVSRDGSNASNIVKAARRFGLAARGFRKEPSEPAELPMPCIIHWNFNHFVVLEGIRADRVFINDPAMGRRQIDMAELDLAFTGVVLAMEPTAEFVKVGAKPQGIAAPARELRGSKPAVALLVAVSLALVVPGIVIPAFSKVFVDDILIQNTSSWLIPLLIGMGVTARPALRHDGAAAIAAAAPPDQACRGHDQPFSLARAGAADGVLHSTPRRRYRKPRRHQRADRPAALWRRRNQCAQPDLDCILRRRDGGLRFAACRDLCRHVAR